MAALEALDSQSLLLLQTAVYIHDLGFIEQRQSHEAVSVRIAREVLPGFGFLPNQVQQIARTIMATRLPQSPETLAERILADADLSVLDSALFFAGVQT